MVLIFQVWSHGHYLGFTLPIVVLPINLSTDQPAVVLLLAYRRWGLGLALLGMAALIGLSRVYLGFHYPSDVAAGAVLGAAIGAANYGVLASGARGPAAWRWLLWPQLALIFGDLNR